jgi:hypothetical protein
MTSPIKASDRLCEGDEFGLLLRKAEPSPLSAERLERSRSVVCAATIGAGVGAAAAAKTATAAGAGIKVAIVGVVAIAVGTTVWRATSRKEVEPSAVPPGVPALVHPLSVQAAPADPGHDLVRDTPPPAGAPAPAVLAPQALPAKTARVDRAVLQRPASLVDGTPPPSGGAQAPAVDSRAAPAATPRASDLDKQIALYSAARDVAARGDYMRAVAALDDLLARFPSSPIAAEAELGRADYLARAGHLDAAASAFEHLIASEALHGRRGELEQMLGDLRIKQGDCASAQAAYRAALEAGVPERSREAIRRALQRCGGS